MNNMNIGVQFSDNAKTASLVPDEVQDKKLEEDEEEKLPDPLDILTVYVSLFYCHW
jgi:hypothetical protein